MKILVAFSSRHHSTDQIAEEIGITFVDKGLDVSVRQIADAGNLGEFDAFVIGGAVYEGQLLAIVGKLIKQHEDFFKRHPVWLFSSGPIGDPPVPAEEAPQIAELAERIEARGHVVFGGKLDKRNLGWRENLLTAAVHAPEGDFRDWHAIRRWAEEIATELRNLEGTQP